MKFEPNESDYNEYVENVTPTSSAPRNCLWAFIVGGIICTIGQLIFNILTRFDVKEDEAYAYVSLILVLASVILRGVFERVLFIIRYIFRIVEVVIDKQKAYSEFCAYLRFGSARQYRQRFPWQICLDIVALH